MTYDLFIDLMGKISRWCNKTLNETQRNVYWDQIEKIPDTAFEDIVEILIKETPPSGKLPTPDNISLAWYHWRQAHPDSTIAEGASVWCDECEGEGIFSVWYQDYVVPQNQIPPGKDPNNYISWFRTFVPCGMCVNWKKQFPTKGASRPKRFYSKLDILSKGWRLTDPAFDGNRLKTPIERDLGALGDKALQDMNEV